MKKIRITVKDIDRKTSIPKENIRSAVEKVFGVKLDSPKIKVKKTTQKAA